MIYYPNYLLSNYYKIHFDKLLILLSSSSSRDEELEVNDMHLNNNKQTNITKKENNNSKELLQNFQFGKSKPKKQNLYTNCVSLIDQKTNNTEIRNLLIDWFNMLLEKYRSRGKVLYANVFKGKLNMLDKYDRKDWREIIEYNLQRGYEGFYPISEVSYKRDYDVTKGKAWEENVSCRQATQEELAEIDRLNKEREAKGLRTKF